jgi:hypothetical protein
VSRGEPFPYYKQFPATFLVRGLRFTLEQRGAIAVVRDCIWVEGRVALKDAPLLLRCDSETFGRVEPALRSHFRLRGGFLIDPELEQQRKELAPVREAKRRAARARHVQSTRTARAVLQDKTSQDQPDKTSEANQASQDQSSDTTERPGPAPGELRSDLVGPGPALDPGPGDSSNVLLALERMQYGNRTEVVIRMQAAQQMRDQGLDHEDMVRLIRHASDGDNPAGLLRTWIERKQCTEILAKRNGQGRHRKASR